MTGPDGAIYRFEVDLFRKQCLLAEQDEIALTQTYEPASTELEERSRKAFDWLTA